MQKMAENRQHAHDYLSRYRYLTERLKQDATELRQFEKIENERTRGVIQKLTDAVHRDVKNLMQTREEVLSVIDAVESESERQALLFRYINGFSIEKIMDNMYFSKRRVQQLLAGGLDTVSEMIQMAEQKTA